MTETPSIPSENLPVERGMRCPSCAAGSRVTNTYRLHGGAVIERRRECLVCRRVWLTAEGIRES